MYPQLSDVPLIPTPKEISSADGYWEGEDPLAQVQHTISAELAGSAFNLVIAAEGIRIVAGSESAAAQAVNRLSQLVLLCQLKAGLNPAAQGRVKLPLGMISDQPVYAWRGLMLDTSRHFIEVAQIRKLISVMALYNLNVLHLHLTDDQGWRFEVKGWEKLQEVAAWRAGTVEGTPANFDDTDPHDSIPHGGFYTQHELRELVKFAKSHSITIVPEIDLPGHMQAAIAAYPSLGNFPSVQHSVRTTWGISKYVMGVSDEAFAFVKDVLDQVCEVFDSPYIHIGGDEVPRDEWMNNPEVAAKLKAWGYTDSDDYDPADVQRHYLKVAHEIISEHGRKLVGWDEVLETELAQDIIVMNWRDINTLTEAVERGHQVVIANYKSLYFDYAQGPNEPLAIGSAQLPAQKVLADPLFPADFPAEKHELVLGVQAEVWTEYIPNVSHLHYMIFPRLFASAERCWNSSAPTWLEFKSRIKAHQDILQALEIGFRPLD